MIELTLGTACVHLLANSGIHLKRVEVFGWVEMPRKLNWVGLSGVDSGAKAQVGCAFAGSSKTATAGFTDGKRSSGGTMDKGNGGRRCAFASGVGALPCNARSEGPRPIPDWVLQSRCPGFVGFRENPHESGRAERMGACAGGWRGEPLHGDGSAGLGAAGYRGGQWIGCFS